MEKLRLAQLSLLKAELYWERATALRDFQVTELSPAARKHIASLEEQVRRWESMNVQEIIREEY
ncbi:MAG TPA: hypothetical protein VHB20_08505 [Verrucomicrobiae bacterium]|nr:hypothetical protein [Verrucomicrobiae bacterium]